MFQTNADQPKNFSFSPLSLKMAFEMLYPAAGENSKLALETAFGFSDSQPDPFKTEREL
ncbi:MAG: hypothetical protein EBY18_08825, partial [Alphaproteobacteria bacterium]|nr:hypothetical protein [Alphaproteobacteria bacterium]